MTARDSMSRQPGAPRGVGLDWKVECKESPGGKAGSAGPARCEEALPHEYYQVRQMVI